MNPNFPAALEFVWRPEFDSPGQGFHKTPHDPGGGTNGGVIQATWDNAVMAGIVKGKLEDAGRDQLSAVLRIKYWGTVCDALPTGLDLLLFNGRMMTGKFTKLFQQSLGFIGPDSVDGWIGPQTLTKASACDARTLIDALSGAHAAYLGDLSTFMQFGRGWTIRLKAAQTAALAMAAGGGA